MFYLVSRALHLDSDLPSWAISFYSPIDEFYYTQLSFELNEHTPTLGGYDIQYDISLSSLFLLQSYITGLSLWLVGDSYYGLRLPSLVMGLVVFVIFLKIAIGRFGPKIGALFGLMLLTDFSFILSNRVAEPTIFRLAVASMIVVYLIRSIEKGYRYRSLVAGFISTAGWLFVYPSNVFLLLAGSASMLLGCRRGNLVASYKKMLAGALLACVVFLAVVYILFPSFYGTTADYVFYAYSPRTKFDVAEMARNVYYLKEANFFRHNYYFFIFVIGVLLAVVYYLISNRITLLKVWKELYVSDKVILIFLSSFVAQTSIINDFPQRKLVFILPFILYFVFLAVARLRRAKVVAVLGVKKYVFFLFLPGLVTQSVYSLSQIFYHPKYEYSQAMKQLKELDGKYVVGGWSMGFRLYNDYKTYLNKYVHKRADRELRYAAHLREIAETNDDVFVIDYEGSSEYYSKLGYSIERVVMRSNDPSNQGGQNVMLFRNERRPRKG